MSDYYQVLGLKKTASASDVKKAYKRLARKYHPDINPGDKGAEERFKEIQEAYSVLKDPEKRKNYDRFGTAEPREAFSGSDFGGGAGFRGFQSGQGRASSFGSFSEIFSDLFGRQSAGRRPAARSRGEDLEFQLTISFLEAVNGTEKRINFNRQVACDTCGGSGSRPGAKARPCPVCRGTGQTQQQHGSMTFSTTCASCGGSGQARGAECGSCGGSGLKAVSEGLKVRIPAGVNTGSRVRISQKGNGGRNGGSPGDLYIVVKVEPHELFWREGNQIYCEIPVTVTEAALGANIEVPTVSGKARLRIPAGTQSGQKFRLKNRGVRGPRGGARGDQIVQTRIVLPQLQDARSREILEELARLHPENPRKTLGLR